MNLKVGLLGKRFRVRFILTERSPIVICIIESRGVVYSGVAIPNVGEVVSLETGKKLSFKRALEAALLGEIYHNSYQDRELGRSIKMALRNAYSDFRRALKVGL